ncbi:DNA-binding transcriptional regulator, LacI/PurR family [Nonomuraea solani]|uniref:DNA-binding transcriptional regulator, LacI/PurR family n=1 Tax=Nonomuraea solani TaxID=1144553 RepID=A0A1H6E4L8_9ACTN|nr:LacI family DNA-binding transcriptional regulator [Nonomuraea solani]SEG91835.1 DNA-binding transcriptional regulator, LacI/PurR family [Nonomuraea solani]
MATMREVAERAKVSIATVSFVINGTKPVAPETRARIEAAIRELDYRRNVVARALASSRTHILALLHPDLESRPNATVIQFVMSAAHGARERGYDLVLWPINDDEQMSHLLAGGLVDGALLMEVQIHDSRVDRLIASRVPFALIGRTENDDLPFVDIDFDTTIHQAVDHLRSYGHRRIALVTQRTKAAPGNEPGRIMRAESAYREAMAILGSPPAVITVEGTSAGGREAARALAADAPEATAVILMNEGASAGLVKGSRALGRDVPGHLSIVSVSTTRELGEMIEPSLTVMEAPAAPLGRLAVNALIDQLEGVQDAPPHRLIPCTLVPGQSVGPPPSRT